MLTVTLQCSEFLMDTITLKCSARCVHYHMQCSVLLMVTVTSNSSAPYEHCHTAGFNTPHDQCNLEVFSSYGQLFCSLQCSSWSLSLWIFQLLKVTITLQCSVFLMVTVILKYSARYGHYHTAVFSVSYGHSQFEVFSCLWSLSRCSVQCS